MPESPAVHPVPTTDGGFTPAQVAAAVEHGREMIRVGSKSFSLASKLLPRGAREGAWLLYAWCRHCDDEIDEAPTREERARRLADLRRRTELAYRDELTAEERAELLAHPIFVAFRQVARSCGIPRFYALELLEGMAMDLNHRPYGDERELRLYCYRVAGVVGLMMSHVMGLSDERALRHASDLGSAMQLTNIARDVLDDAALGRMYLPRPWLAAEGLDPTHAVDPDRRVALAKVVARLLDEAEGLYRSGLEGLRYLAPRCAFGVLAAACIYREIGRQVRARGDRAWDTRTVVSTGRKLVLVLRAAWELLTRRGYRAPSDWAPVAIRAVHAPEV